ncbi:MAG: DNA primase [Candidatus Omnitrophica bacterium]|nr:DNA primase [Candidatus Omnitrophota bacterium]
MPLIPEEVIQQVIDRCDVVETIGAYIPLKRAGRSFKACCPFHQEKTPSFVVTPAKQIFHCFGCGVGGNVISFVMKFERLEFAEALRALAQKNGIVIPQDTLPRTQTVDDRQDIFRVNQLAADFFHKVLLSGSHPACVKARQYLQDRGVNEAAIAQFHLGFSPDQWDGLTSHLQAQKIPLVLMEKAGLIIPRDNGSGYYDRFRNRIMFPIYDGQTHCRAFGGRALESSTAKYINSPETNVYTKGHHLYGFDLAKRSIIDKDQVIIVEGYMDCLIPFQAGVTQVVASLGTALTVEQIRLIRRYTRQMVFLYDMDNAGEAAMVRSLDMLVEEGMNVRVARLSDGEDPDSYVRRFGVEAFQQRIKEAETLFAYKWRYLGRHIDTTKIEGKAKIIAEMLGIVGRFENLVIQADCLRQLSQAYGVSEDILRQEMRKGRDADWAGRLRREPSSVGPVAVHTRSLEMDILKLLLDAEELIAATKRELSPADFDEPQIRAIIQQIYVLHDRGESVTPGSLINAFADLTARQLISALAARDDGQAADTVRMHGDYMRQMKLRRVKMKREHLLAKIKEAEHLGDNHTLGNLMQEFNQLIKVSDKGST